MIVKVHMLAFGHGEIREVRLPDDIQPADTANLLNLVFSFGQNENQRRDQPSVSVGDVIELPDGDRVRYYVVRGVRFAEMTHEELCGYYRIPQRDRAWSRYARPH